MQAGQGQVRFIKETIARTVVMTCGDNNADDDDNCKKIDEVETENRVVDKEECNLCVHAFFLNKGSLKTSFFSTGVPVS